MKKKDYGLTGEADFTCWDCLETFHLILYSGVPVYCPECGSHNVELEEMHE